MFAKIWSISKGFSTSRTMIRLDDIMNSKVLDQVRPLDICLTTGQAHMWLVLGMSPPVSFQQHLLFKLFITEVTGIRWLLQKVLCLNYTFRWYSHYVGCRYFPPFKNSLKAMLFSVSSVYFAIFFKYTWNKHDGIEERFVSNKHILSI